MKATTYTTCILASLLTLAIVGCDKSDTNKAADDVKKTTEGAAATVQEGATKAVDQAKEAGTKAAETVTDKVKEAGGEAGAIIAKAQSLVSEKKYQEALTTLGGLKDMKLTDSQQKIVDDLKAQVQKLMSGDATKALGNALGK